MPVSFENMIQSVVGLIHSVHFLDLRHLQIVTVFIGGSSSQHQYTFGYFVHLFGGSII